MAGKPLTQKLIRTGILRFIHPESFRGREAQLQPGLVEIRGLENCWLAGTGCRGYGDDGLCHPDRGYKPLLRRKGDGGHYMFLRNEPTEFGG